MKKVFAIVLGLACLLTSISAYADGFDHTVLMA